MPTTPPSIGIDLGTSNSAVATATDGPLRLLERSTGQRLLPSFVGVRGDGQFVVGEAARALAETAPADVVWAAKRLLGQRWTPELARRCKDLYPWPVVGGATQDCRVKLAGQTVPVTQLSALLLGELRGDAEASLGREVRKAVITVPAAFTDAQRQATRDAASIAGLEVLRLINEPTAAAIAYGLATGFSGKVVVFDLGGGTFDVSALSVSSGVFEVVATDGDPNFGGEDFDQAVVDWLLDQLPDPALREQVRRSKSALQQLKANAELAKIALSTVQRVPVSLALPLDERGRTAKLACELSRATFEGLVKGQATRCLDLVERTLAQARWAEAEVDAVLLVGGMTRAPVVRSLVAQRFGRLPRATVNPDEAVALGAAVHAAELVERRGGALLLDVLGSSLGIGVAGGLTQPLITRNTSLPCRVEQTVYPSRDGQAVVRLPIVQGEARHVANNVALGELVLEGLLGARRLESAITVAFALSQDGVLSVSARDERSGVERALTLQARASLAAAETERLATREQARQQQVARVPLDERARARDARRALRHVTVAARKLLASLKAVGEHDAAAAALTEALAQRVVEAERVETSGTAQQALALAVRLVEDLRRLGSSAAPSVPEGTITPPAQPTTEPSAGKRARARAQTPAPTGELAPGRATWSGDGAAPIHAAAPVEAPAPAEATAPEEASAPVQATAPAEVLAEASAPVEATARAEGTAHEQAAARGEIPALTQASAPAQATIPAEATAGDELAALLRANAATALADAPATLGSAPLAAESAQPRQAAPVPRTHARSARREADTLAPPRARLNQVKRAAGGGWRSGPATRRRFLSRTGQ